MLSVHKENQLTVSEKLWLPLDVRQLDQIKHCCTKSPPDCKRRDNILSPDWNSEEFMLTCEWSALWLPSSSTASLENEKEM